MCLKQKPLNIWSSIPKQKLVLGKKQKTPSIHEVSNVYFPIENRLFTSISCWSTTLFTAPTPYPQNWDSGLFQKHSQDHWDVLLSSQIP